jgi:hypothetical protein
MATHADKANFASSPRLAGGPDRWEFARSPCHSKSARGTVERVGCRNSVSLTVAAKTLRKRWAFSQRCPRKIIDALCELAHQKIPGQEHDAVRLLFPMLPRCRSCPAARPSGLAPNVRSRNSLFSGLSTRLINFSACSRSFAPRRMWALLAHERVLPSSDSVRIGWDRETVGGEEGVRKKA